MSELHRITADPDQLGGRPCVRGLRVRVKCAPDGQAAAACSFTPSARITLSTVENSGLRSPDSAL